MGLPSGWFSLIKEDIYMSYFPQGMGEFRLPCLIGRGYMSNCVEIVMAVHCLRFLKMTCPWLHMEMASVTLATLIRSTKSNQNCQFGQSPSDGRLGKYVCCGSEIWGHDIIDLVKHLQLQCVVLLGHSLGGMIVPWRFDSAESAEQHAMVNCRMRTSMMGDGHLFIF